MVCWVMVVDDVPMVVKRLPVRLVEGFGFGVELRPRRDRLRSGRPWCGCWSGCWRRARRGPHLSGFGFRLFFLLRRRHDDLGKLVLRGGRGGKTERHSDS